MGGVMNLVNRYQPGRTSVICFCFLQLDMAGECEVSAKPCSINLVRICSRLKSPPLLSICRTSFGPVMRVLCLMLFRLRSCVCGGGLYISQDRSTPSGSITCDSGVRCLAGTRSFTS